MTPTLPPPRALLEPAAFERAACPKCGADRNRTVHVGRDWLHDLGGEFRASECAACGLWFQNPRPRAEALARLYPDEYGPHAESEASRAPGRPIRRAVKAVFSLVHRTLMRRRAEGIGLVPRRVPSGRLLEIGCGAGARLQSLRSEGWSRLHGIELVPAAAERAVRAGFEVACGRLEDALPGYPAAHFDAVIASMVLEHLADPFRVVRDVARVLKPGGEFLFSTVIRDSVDARLYGRYWAGLDFPRHLVHFRLKDIRDMVEPGFTRLERFHQTAAVDFVRASSWRRAAADPAVAALFGSRVGDGICWLLALARMTCRVSFRCRRKASP